MSTNYNANRRSQRERQAILETLRKQLGDKLFADFMIDRYAESGPTISVADLPCLAGVWLINRPGSPPDGVKVLTGKTTSETL